MNDFKKEADQAVAELERYAQEGDLEKTFALLHKLQPNFAMLGLNTLCENSKTLQKILMQDDNSLEILQVCINKMAINLQRASRLVSDKIDLCQ